MFYGKNVVEHHKMCLWTAIGAWHCTSSVLCVTETVQQWWKNLVVVGIVGIFGSICKLRNGVVFENNKVFDPCMPVNLIIKMLHDCLVLQISQKRWRAMMEGVTKVELMVVEIFEQLWGGGRPSWSLLGDGRLFLWNLALAPRLLLSFFSFVPSVFPWMNLHSVKLGPACCVMLNNIPLPGLRSWWDPDGGCGDSQLFIIRGAHRSIYRWLCVASVH